MYWMSGSKSCSLVIDSRGSHLSRWRALATSPATLRGEHGDTDTHVIFVELKNAGAASPTAALGPE